MSMFGRVLGPGKCNSGITGRVGLRAGKYRNPLGPNSNISGFGRTDTSPVWLSFRVDQTTIGTAIYVERVRTRKTVHRSSVRVDQAGNGCYVSIPTRSDKCIGPQQFPCLKPHVSRYINS